jgi:Xaa-Pro dipeptidase
MRERGIDHCISVAPELLFYYGGHDSWVSVNSPQAVIFSAADGDADHMLRETDIALARESSWIADVRAYRLMFDDIPGIMAAVAREQGLADGRVAIETQSYALPFALGTVLARALEPARIVDATELTGIPRLIKSPARNEVSASGAAHAQVGLDAACQTLRPGISEIELAAAIRRSGVGKRLLR